MTLYTILSVYNKSTLCQRLMFAETNTEHRPRLQRIA